MEFLKFEDKVKKWIENNKVKWLFLLSILGIGLGIFETYLLGGGLELGLIICFIYNSVLISCELILGGSGTI